MKYWFLSLFLLAAGAASAQNESARIEGSGNIVKKEYPVSAFSELEASGMYSLVLHAGNKDAVIVETDDNLQELFHVDQSGKKVHITMKTKEGRGMNFRNKTTMIVHVTVSNLEKLEINLMGSTRSEGVLPLKSLRVENKGMGQLALELNGDHLELVNEGMGRVVLKGNADDAGILNKGMGALDAADFKVRSLTLSNKGMGKATVNATEELIYKDSFMGKVTNVGGAKTVSKVE